MPSEVLPPDGENGKAGLQCSKCGKANQFARLIVDPVTGREFNFFECVVCGHPNWVQTREE